MLGLIFVITLFSTASGSPIHDRIVNGTDARPGEFPQLVSLRLADIHNCGATVLNPRYLLTAAHCVQFNVSYYTVQYGITLISSGADALNIIKVSRLIPHENYTAGDGYANDVALVELERPLNFTTWVQPVKLPNPFEETPEHCIGRLAGWGDNVTGGFIMNKLQKANIYVFSDDYCEMVYEEDGPTNRTYHICAGVPQGGKGQCSGDSGGPLLVNGVQFGIVSWSKKPCTSTGYPGVFTKVSTYVEWIREKINE